jgi:hypothetical protein
MLVRMVTGSNDITDDADVDGRNGRTNKRPAAGTGRGRGRRNVPDMSSVRSSSRKVVIVRL